MALSTPKKLAVLTILILLVVVAASGALVYTVMQEVEVEWEQDPNKVELLEANRKFDLLNKAVAENRKGFIRLSEVEINSWLEDRYGKPQKPSTNSVPEDAVEVQRVVALLDDTELTLITRLDKPLYGKNVPLVWQRRLRPLHETNGWKLVEMRVGDLKIPERFWGDIHEQLKESDEIFDERRVWLASLPAVRLMRNDTKRQPELRLYSYNPEEKKQP